jgi:hypothetical protein
MKQKHILSIAFIILMISFGCKKSSDSPAADLGANAVGTYTGNYTVLGQSIAGTCAVTKASTTSVNIAMTVAGQSAGTLSAVNVSDGGSGKINLSYSDASGSMTGNIQGNTLTMTIISGGTTMTFSGSKP